MLMNFEDDTPTTPVKKWQSKTRASISPSSKHLYKDEQYWGPQELHDYVLSKMDPDAEVADNDAFIFQHFMKRWGDKAIQIAKFAFDVSDGKWHGKSVAPLHFLKAYDAYFAEEIARLLETR